MTLSTTPHLQRTQGISESIASLGLGDDTIADVSRALIEDIGAGDITTDSIVPSEANASARIIAKQDGIVSGLDICRSVFLLLSSDMHFNSKVTDGALVVFGQSLLELTGSARAILTAERTALNFLGRMSGIATLTGQFVSAIAGTEATILDTRKTAPGLRTIDKLAVKHGGGENHRLGLYDMVLIKNNHIDCAGSLSKAVELVRASSNLDIQVEARTIDEVNEALTLGVSRILLDNMSLHQMRIAVGLGAGQAKLEASGNVTLDNVRAIAETGVDYISVGALTHSAKAFDVSLRWIS